MKFSTEHYFLCFGGILGLGFRLYGMGSLRQSGISALGTGGAWWRGVVGVSGIFGVCAAAVGISGACGSSAAGVTDTSA